MTAEVQQAFAIGWQAGEYHVSGRDQELAQVRATLDAFVKRVPAAAAVGDAELTRDLVQLQAAMTAADFRYGKAFRTGARLATMTLKTNSVETFNENFSPEAVSELQEWIADLTSVLADHAGQAVSDSLTYWFQYRLSAPQQWPKTMTPMVVRQGRLWRAVLSGEKDAKDMLAPDDYLAAGLHVFDKARRLLGTGIARSWRWSVPLLALVLALAIGVVVLVANDEDAASVVAGLVALAGSVGVTWKSVSASLRRAGELLGKQVWGAELDAAIAIAITELPTVVRTGARLQPSAGSVLDQRRALQHLTAEPPRVTLSKRAVRRAGQEVWKRLGPDRRTLALAHNGPSRWRRLLYRVLRLALPSRAPYIPTDPFLSAVQTALEREVAINAAKTPQRAATAPAAEPRPSEEVFGRFGPYDWHWLTTIVSDLIGDLRGHHAFNDVPAEAEIRNRTRLFLVSDWATGRERAQKVSKEMEKRIAATLDETNPPDVQVIHLGDVYYAGHRDEYTRRFQALWPARNHAADVHSWNLNGNHDMYSGGHAYFTVLGTDDSFRAQRAGSGGTSFFRLTNDHWQVIGLDTAYVDRKFTPPQLDALETWLTPDGQRARKTILLSHHQLDSVHDRGRISRHVLKGVKPYLDAGAIDVWFWGHEHRCVAYQPMFGLKAPRCIGHGGVPELAQWTAIVFVKKLGQWVKGVFTARRVSWARIDHEYLAKHVDDDGRKWRMQGFAILDLDGDSAWATYVDEDGTEHWFDGLNLGPSAPGDAARTASPAPVKFG
jgi:3',5'-cyclic AMP phosphodiesterase CpdA